MINVIEKNSNIRGSQEPNSAFRNVHPNKNIANKNVRVKESVNHKNSIKMRRGTICIHVRIFFIDNAMLK